MCFHSLFLFYLYSNASRPNEGLWEVFTLTKGVLHTPQLLTGLLSALVAQPPSPASITNLEAGSCQLCCFTLTALAAKSAGVTNLRARSSEW